MFKTLLIGCKIDRKNCPNVETGSFLMRFCAVLLCDDRDDAGKHGDDHHNGQERADHNGDAVDKLSVAEHSISPLGLSIDGRILRL